MEHSCEVWLKLAKWYVSHLRQIFDAGSPTMTDPNG